MTTPGYRNKHIFRKDLIVFYFLLTDIGTYVRILYVCTQQPEIHEQRETIIAQLRDVAQRHTFGAI